MRALPILVLMLVTYAATEFPLQCKTARLLCKFQIETQVGIDDFFRIPCNDKNDFLSSVEICELCENRAKKPKYYGDCGNFCYTKTLFEDCIEHQNKDHQQKHQQKDGQNNTGQQIPSSGFIILLVLVHLLSVTAWLI